MDSRGSDLVAVPITATLPIVADKLAEPLPMRKIQHCEKRRGWDSNPRYAVRRTTVFETAPFTRSGPPPGNSVRRGILRMGRRPRAQEAPDVADAASVQDSTQTRIGRFFDRHTRTLRAFALLALLWSAAYLTWRIGWSGEGTSPVVFAMLLVTEFYGFWALGTLAWYSWSRPAVERPPATQGRKVDVYVCTYDEPVEVVAATLAGCRALTYPHTTYLLDDGRREEMRELAGVAGAQYLTRPDNSHAKAGNINAALPRTEGDLVLMLDADHVPMPDALDAMVGYFDDERVALVQSPHDFFNHDSVQHYVVGRHEQSLFYRVVCPGKNRHGAAYWCGSAAVLRRQALLEICLLYT